MIENFRSIFCVVLFLLGYLLLGSFQSLISLILNPSNLDGLDQKSNTEAINEVGSVMPLYSSFNCIGTGSQAFDWGVWLTTDRTLCKIYEVCMVDGELTYYEDPAIEGSAPEIYRVAAATASIRHGLWQAHEPKLRVVSEERPQELSFAPGGRLYALDVMSDASNFGHLLIDTIIPAFAAAVAFGAEPSSLQILEMLSCENFLQRTTMQHKKDNADTYIEMCQQHLNRWIPALFFFLVIPFYCLLTTETYAFTSCCLGIRA